MEANNKALTKVEQLKSIMNAPSVQEQFNNALKDNKDVFVASLIDLYNTDNNLQACEPKAIVMEALKAAVLKLPINKALGFAYIVPFKIKGVQKPNFILGYKGYYQLAMRTGYYKTINYGAVYDGELNVVDKLAGEINLDGKKLSNKVVGYFAHFEMLNGFKKTVYMTLEQIAKHAKMYSKGIQYNKNVTVASLMKLAGSDATGIGWAGDFDSMAVKTVLKNLLSKYGYLSVEMQTAVAKEIDAENNSDDEKTDKQVVDIDAYDVEDMGKQSESKQETTTEPEQEEQPPYM